MEKQPAKKSYFFGKGYKDIKNTIIESWQRNADTARYYQDKTTEFWENWEKTWFWKPLAFGTVFAGISVLVFGTTFFLALSAIHITILVMVFLTIYILFSLLWGIDKIYRFWRRVFVSCPVCHHKADLPHYLCPNCNNIHTRLIPSSYGIFKRRCECGEKLPTTFFNGRSDLPAICPKCKHELKTGEATPICIPIVGGQSVGKTCFLFSAAKGFIEDIASKNSWNIRFLDQQNQELYNRVSRNFSHGMLPAKTPDLTPTAFNFFIASKRWHPEKLMYFYDAAGESVKNANILVRHKFYSYFHGIIFIIDPFSIPELMADYQRNLKRHEKEIKPSDMMLDDAFDTMLINLEKNYKLKREQAIKQPCAIVINKVDAFDLSDRIGENAAKELMKQDTSIKTISDAINKLCKDNLTEWGLGHFIRNLEYKFSNYRFFTCSALGHLPNNDAFQAYGATEPLMWLLSQINKKDFRSK
jgi:GTPase SAR1 family protein